MSLDPDKQSRTCGTKVRTGCLTCKSRRLKCDEDFQAGSCLRCRKGKRVCRTTTSQLSELKIVRYVSQAPRNPSHPLGLNERDAHYFQRFCDWTALDLAGSFSPEFWTQYAVQIAMHEPAIKHAVVALSALHEQYQAKRSLSLSDPGMQYPLSQCTNALALLTKTMSSKQNLAMSHTALIACMLFCAFDSMSYHLDSAISHLKGGIRVLVEQLRRSNAAPGSCDDSSKLLQPLFVRLDTQGLQLSESLATQDHFPFPYDLQVARFNTVSEAHRAYSESFNLMLRTIYSADDDPVGDEHLSDVEGLLDLSGYDERATKAGSVYSKWCTSFDEFVTRGVAAEDLQPCMLMQIWRLATNINVQIDLKKGDMDYDRFYKHFESVVELVYEFLLSCTQHHQSLEAHRLHGSHADRSGISQGAFFYHHGPNSGNLRSGNLHLHPDRTPFVSSLALDANVHRTTTILLGRARTDRPGYLRHLEPGLLSELWLPDMRPSFSFSTGIIVPLYVTISRCRDPHLRRRALALMQHCKRREGLWDSDLAARLGERVIDIEERQASQLLLADLQAETAFEESSAFVSTVSADDKSARTPEITHASQIPNEARVRIIRPTFLPDRRSVERYFMGWSGAWQDAKHEEERWIEEEMEW